METERVLGRLHLLRFPGGHAHLRGSICRGTGWCSPARSLTRTELGVIPGVFHVDRARMLASARELARLRPR